MMPRINITLKEVVMNSFARYLVTGGLSALLEYGLFLLLACVVEANLTLSNAISSYSGFLLSFGLNRVWSFQSRSGLLQQFISTNLLLLANIAITSTLLHLMVHGLSVPSPIAKMVLMALVCVWNYVIFKFIIFRQDRTKTT
jgi:putative flippase GtrA